MVLQLDKPLRRGRYITNLEGQRIWVTFKYERLATVCYICGKIGHDDGHHLMPKGEQTYEHQYLGLDSGKRESYRKS